MRSCSVGGAAQVELVSSLSFNMEKEIARETEVLCRSGSENVPRPSGAYVCDLISRLAAAVVLYPPMSYDMLSYIYSA